MEVCSVVQSILAAFNSGLDVVRRMGVKHKSKKKSKEPPSAQELQLHESLHRRPQEIKSGYDSRVAVHGHRFEIGDTIAHTSLAHTLLVLNSGLIHIINSALSDDPRKRSMSQRSLLSLSEIAAADAINALSQLDLRLTASSQLSLMPAPSTPQPREKAVHDSVHKAKHPNRHVAKGSNNPFKSTLRPAPSPVLFRGGWVRPKSNSSVASAASTSKISIVRPADHKRSKSTSMLPKESQESKSHSTPNSPPRVQTPPQSPPQSPPAPKVEVSDDNDVARHRRRRTSSNPCPRREPSMLLVPSDFFSAQTSSQPDQQQQRPQPQTNAPPIPPKIPLHSRPTTSGSHNHRHKHSSQSSIGTGTGIRPRPPSVATFMTASTKIGEIPEHLWPNRPVLAGEQERPLPYVIPPPLTAGFGDERKKAKGRGFRFWKKGGQVEEEGKTVLAF